MASRSPVQPRMPTDSANEEYEYLWRHFAFNAEQRLKGFNFFVVLAVFADGGVFTALEQEAHAVILFLLGGFVCALAVVFWLIDCRSQALIALAVPGLEQYETRFPEQSRIFGNDKPGLLARYSTAFQLLFVLQFLFGLGVLADALLRFLASY
jgi:hypothetical protein